MRNEVIQWLNRQIQDFPKNKLLVWSKASFEKDNGFVLPENEKDANVRIIEQLTLPGM